MKYTPIDADMLTTPCTLYRPVEQPDGGGGVDTTFVAAQDGLYAAIIPIQGSTIGVAGHAAPSVFYNVFMRYRADVRAGWRLEVAGRILEIKSVVAMGREEYLALTCTEIVV